MCQWNRDYPAYKPHVNGYQETHFWRDLICRGVSHSVPVGKLAIPGTISIPLADSPRSFALILISISGNKQLTPCHSECRVEPPFYHIHYLLCMFKREMWNERRSIWDRSSSCKTGCLELESGCKLNEPARWVLCGPMFWEITANYISIVIARCSLGFPSRIPLCVSI